MFSLVTVIFYFFSAFFAVCFKHIGFVYCNYVSQMCFFHLNLIFLSINKRQVALIRQLNQHFHIHRTVCDLDVLWFHSFLPLSDQYSSIYKIYNYISVTISMIIKITKCDEHNEKHMQKHTHASRILIKKKKKKKKYGTILDSQIFTCQKRRIKY